MKIVCDACQAKYSIADEKVQGKAFKIRCKKCNHIIVVRSSSERAVGAAAETKPAPAEAQGTWYVVVEGEQIGPLAEPDIAARMGRGEITGESLVWKEGFADWVKLSAVPELAQMPSSQATPGAQPTSAPAAEPAPVRRDSARMRAHGSAKEAAMAAAPGEDIFSKPAPAASASVDLFASPAAAYSSAAAEAPATAGFAFGAASAPAPEPAARAPGNGAGESHMTGQRNENSVLFSLANLEALAVPSSSTSARAPSTTSTTEGSGLIDIRSMAARTIGESGRDDAFGGSDALPTFSTPQFSPVAPVFLPMASSGPPKWVYPVLGVLALGIVALGLGIYKVVSVPPPPPPAPPQIVVPALVAPPAPAAAPSPGVPASAQPAKPVAAEEKPGEEKAATEKRKPSGKGGKSVAKSQTEAVSSAKGAQSTPEQPAPPTPAPAKPKKGGSIDDLLDQVNTNRRGGEEPKPKKVVTAAALPSLSQSDIVSAMKAVQPRVKECYNQYKVAGIANVSISISKGGRIASATVTPGKFAGTPSGTCVEAAAKTAKFPPCEAMSFPWPFQLH